MNFDDDIELFSIQVNFTQCLPLISFYQNSRISSVSCQITFGALKLPRCSDEWRVTEKYKISREKIACEKWKIFFIGVAKGIQYKCDCGSTMLNMIWIKGKENRTQFLFAFAFVGPIEWHTFCFLAFCIWCHIWATLWKVYVTPIHNINLCRLTAFWLISSKRSLYTCIVCACAVYIECVCGRERQIDCHKFVYLWIVLFLLGITYDFVHDLQRWSWLQSVALVR